MLDQKVISVHNNKVSGLELSLNEHGVLCSMVRCYSVLGLEARLSCHQ